MDHTEENGGRRECGWSTNSILSISVHELSSSCLVTATSAQPSEKKKKKNSSQLLHWRTKGLVVVDWLYQWWCCALEPYCEKSCLARYIKCNARPHSMSFIKCCICAVKVSSSHLVSHCTVCGSGWLLFLQQFESLPSKLSDASHCHISVRLTLHITRTSMLYSDKNKEKKNTPHITCIIDCII